LVPRSDAFEGQVNFGGLHAVYFEKNTSLHWPPYVIGQAIIFLPCDFYQFLLLLSFFLA